MEIRSYLNGKETAVNASPERLLVDVLREDLHLTGTKRGCGEGECGTCTVLLDDKAVHACMTMIAQVNGHRVITSEGGESDPRIAPIIPAFVNNMAIQCGYCEPGMIMADKAQLDRPPHPTREEIHAAMSGNLCRCTGYTKIEEAIVAASKVIEQYANGKEAQQ